MASSSSLKLERSKVREELAKVKERISNIKQLIRNAKSFGDYVVADGEKVDLVSMHIEGSFCNKGMSEKLSSAIKENKEKDRDEDEDLLGLIETLEKEKTYQENKKEELEARIESLNTQIENAIRREREERAKKKEAVS